MLFIVCLSNLVDILSWPKLDLDFNLWAVFDGLACLTDGLDVTIERENVVKRDRKIILYIVKHK